MPLIFLLTKNTPRSNFKISSIMKQSEILSYKKIANILHQFKKECALSEEFLTLTAEHALYEDSCNVVKLKRQISELINFLGTVAENAKIEEKG